jgi:hypothetical protein
MGHDGRGDAGHGHGAREGDTRGSCAARQPQVHLHGRRARGEPERCRRLYRPVQGHLARREEALRLRTRALRGREAAVHDHGREHGAVRGQAHRGPEGPAAQVPEALPHQRLSLAPRLSLRRLGVRDGEAQRRDGHGRERRPRHHRRHRGAPVPVPQERARGDLERDQSAPGMDREGGVRHRRRLCQRLDRLGPQQVHDHEPGQRPEEARLLPGPAEHQRVLLHQLPAAGARQGLHRGGLPAQRLHRRRHALVAVPAGPAARAPGPGGRLRLPGAARGAAHGGRRLRVQRLAGALHVETGRQEGALPAVPQLPRQRSLAEVQGADHAEHLQPGVRALRAAPLLGDRGHAQARRAPHLQVAHHLRRRGHLAGDVGRQLRRPRPALARGDRHVLLLAGVRHLPPRHFAVPRPDLGRPEAAARGGN